MDQKFTSQDSPDEAFVICSRCYAENHPTAAMCAVCDLHLMPSRPPSGRAAAPLNSKPEAQRWGGVKLSKHVKLIEAAAGLVLLVAVLGYVIFSWAQKDQQSAAYREGVAAEQSKDWDKAASAFDHAGDMQDALTRRDNARQQAAGRDSLYRDAAGAEAQRNWPVAISKLQQVLAIQPGYKDSETRLEADRQQSVQDGASGLVYLVDRGDHPGLYVRGAGGQAQFLPGSDRQSVVRAVAPGGRAVVYDRPGGTGRVIALARLNPAPTVRVTCVHELPWLDSGGTGVFAGRGFWWLSTAWTPGNLTAYEVFYQSGDMRTPAGRVDGGLGARVIALGPEQSQVVLARTLQRASGEQTELYVAGEAGQKARLLDRVEGQVTGAALSPDGQWLVYASKQEDGTSGRTRETLMAEHLPVAGDDRSPGSYALQLIDAAVEGTGQSAANLQATFVSDSAGQPKVLVIRTRQGGASVSLYDPERRRTTGWWSGTDVGDATPELVGLSSDGSLIALRGQQGTESVIEVINWVQGVPQTSETHLTAFPEQRLRVAFSPSAGRAIITVASDPDGPRVAPSLYVAPIASERIGEPTRLAWTHWARLYGVPGVALSSDGGVLAYVTPSNELRAMRVDGTATAVLASGVGAVWNLQTEHMALGGLGGSLPLSVVAVTGLDTGVTAQTRPAGLAVSGSPSLPGLRVQR